MNNLFESTTEVERRSRIRNMEMVAATEVESIGVNLTPPLSPLAYSLHDSFLHSHCAACFSPLPLDPPLSLHSLLYCSPSCSSSHSHLHLSSASHHLHLHLSQNSYDGQISDLRVALLLLLQIKRHQALEQYDRICGLMSNRRELLQSINDDEFSTRIKEGARAMAAAIMMRDGVSNSDSDSSEDFLLEESVLCVVVTNAVEVQDRFGRLVGIAVYDIHFSWINHSCSPNACYLFLPPESRGGGQRFLISPASSNGRQPSGISSNSQFITESTEIDGGPRAIVRNIKPMKKGEQVTIAYTDLLQPKESRQLELWSKYRFTCRCNRCVTMPPTHVDQCLHTLTSPSNNDVGIEQLTDYINDAIDDYLSSNNAESSCKKLESFFSNGFHYEHHIIKSRPQHHLSLNAYTTLTSAYKIRSMNSMNENQNLSHAINMKRFSVAYSLLLAIITHDFFLSEYSLISSVSNFWIGVGESMVDLAGRLVPDCDSEIQSFKCVKCGLIDVFEANFDEGQSPEKVLELSKKFMDCIVGVLPNVWEFLAHGNSYLEVVKDPIGLLKHVKEIVEGQEIVEVLLWVGCHCLLYGGVLMNICGGHALGLSCYVRGIVNGGDGKTNGE